MFERFGKAGLGLFLSLFAVGVVSGLWLAGMSFTGTLTATPGTAAEAIAYDWNVVINSNNNDTQEFTYYNDDGPQWFEFALDTSGISSTSETCLFEPGKDLRFYLQKASYTMPINDTATVNLMMQPGNNTFRIVCEPDPARCGLTGTISMTATLL